MCVLIARAFNQIYSLKLTVRGEMELAYKVAEWMWWWCVDSMLRQLWWIGGACESVDVRKNGPVLRLW